jgi:molybdenum cofactor cytidylyltransferase
MVKIRRTGLLEINAKIFHRNFSRTIHPMSAPYDIAVILLAAGGSSRMRGADKLLEAVGGVPLLRRVAEGACAATVSQVIVVFGSKAQARQDALAGLPIHPVTNDAWQSGMASSIAAGVNAVSPQTDGALIVLGDMPEVDSALMNTLIGVFDPEGGKDIVRPVAASGPVGNPVLFGRRHFPALMALTGDSGAKPIIAAQGDSVVDVPVNDDSVLIDLDTPEAWLAWRSSQ